MSYIYICICKSCSSRVNETEKPFKDSLGYLSNPLNPCPHPPNPRFKDSPWNLNNLNLLQLIFTSKSLGSQQTCVKFLFQFRKKRKLDFINFFFVFFSISIPFYTPHSHPDSPHPHPYSGIPTLIPRIYTLIPRIPNPISRILTPFPAFPLWFLAFPVFPTFPTPFPAFPPWFPAFWPWFPAFPPWFPALPPWLLAFRPWFPAFPPWSPAFPWFPSFRSPISHCSFYR